MSARQQAGRLPAVRPAHEPGPPGAPAAPQELRGRMAEDGYLVVRAAVPRQAVDEVRGALVEILVAAGLVEAAAGGDGSRVLPVDPAAPVDVHSDADLFRRLYSLEVLHRLPHHRQLLTLVETLLGEGEVLVHPRAALRAVFPGTPDALGATAPHQDLLGMQGTPDAYTVWVALTQCPQYGGVIALAGGSHREGLRPYLPRAGDRVAGCDDAGLEGSWVATDLEPGDAVVFHSCTVHRALPNRSGAVRLSLDARYQRAADPVCEATLAERADLPWDDIYRGWSEAAAPYRRYWESMPLRRVPLDVSKLAPAAADRKAR